MTMTHEIMNAMDYPERSGGRSEVSIQVIKDILKKHDPEGFNSFEPSF
jgi:hypothetical protein